MQERLITIKRKIPSSWKRQKTRLLVLAGRRKTGKDVLLSYVMRNYPGFRHYRIAEAPTLIARILGLASDRRVLHALFGVNKILYPILKESAYKRRVARLLDGEKPKLAIVEAARTKEEYEEFVRNRKGILVGITANDSIRYERALADAKKISEKRDEGKMSFNEFMKKEYSLIEREIDWIVRRAHFVLDNSQNKKAPFYRAIDEAMKRLGFRKKVRQL
ncbi:MAG: hypothetical protein HYW91_03020 [Candidatus Sungbacteria bacterium]|nr:hypothetical protein [Candidatus Sungbacteria bacterium]